MFNRKCKITFISHGSTVHSEENRISDNEKYPPINEAGEEEIAKICEWLRKRAIKNDKIYTSSALRTTQTAQMISKVFRKDFEVLDGLHARKYGAWSGLTFEQIENKYPQMLGKLHENPCSYCPDKGETILEFNKRVSKCLKKIVDENVGSRIIIVTHPDVVQAAVSKAIRLRPQHQGKVYIKTGSATQISYYENWASLMYSDYVPL